MELLILTLILTHILHKQTCVFNNHEWQNNKNNIICTKCGLIKIKE